MSEGKIGKKWTYLLTGHLALIHIIGRDILELKEREGRSTTLHTYTHRPSSLNPLPAKGQHHYREKNTLYQLGVIYKPCGQVFGVFWPPLPPCGQRWTFWEPPSLSMWIFQWPPLTIYFQKNFQSTNLLEI